MKAKMITGPYIKESLVDPKEKTAMKKKALIVFLLLIPIILSSQHTFSIVAVDSVTGEIGSAGATCGDSIIWPGSPGAKIISDVIPGVGAIHTQAYHNYTNQAYAHDHMLAGESPQQIIDWLMLNDVAANPSIRQYGIVDYNGGHPRSAAFTGSNCNNYKNHIIGPNYAIQGNILLGQQILDSMESGFNQALSTLADKLMAALQGAKVTGADTRCTSEGTSSLSAFIRVAKPNDVHNSLYLDINIAGTPPGVEPIDKLQDAYDIWKQTAGFENMNGHNTSSVELFPNPSKGFLNIKFNDEVPDELELYNILGESMISTNTNIQRFQKLDLSGFPEGLYFLKYKTGNKSYVRKISLIK
jgi:uncharacterized Ntn-hydrolase superfamily protein